MELGDPPVSFTFTVVVYVLLVWLLIAVVHVINEDGKRTAKKRITEDQQRVDVLNILQLKGSARRRNQKSAEQCMGL